MHIHVLCGRRCVYGCLLQVKRLCVCRCGAWMFAETLIHFRFGKFLHYPYVLPLVEVMPNFSVKTETTTGLIDSLLCHAGYGGHRDEGKRRG